MPSVDTIAIARRYLELISTPDPTVLAAVAAPTLVMYLNGVRLPATMTLLQRIQSLHGAIPDYHFTIDDIIAQGDTVAVRYTGAGTQQGELHIAGITIPATSKPLHYVGMALLRIVGGQVVEDWTVADSLGMLQQLGLTLTPGGIS